MEHSLMNPNQLRHFGISVCDDPTDLERPFGIKLGGEDDDLVVPFSVRGTIVSFPARAPTENELHGGLPRTEMTDDAEWDPATVQICVLSWEEEELHRIKDLRCVSSLSSVCFKEFDSMEGGFFQGSEVELGLAQMSPVLQKLKAENINENNVQTSALNPTSKTSKCVWDRNVSKM
jgi:hypothetical protein